MHRFKSRRAVVIFTLVRVSILAAPAAILYPSKFVFIVKSSLFNRYLANWLHFTNMVHSGNNVNRECRRKVYRRSFVFFKVLHETRGEQSHVSVMVSPDCQSHIVAYSRNRNMTSHTPPHQVTYIQVNTEVDLNASDEQ